MAATSWGTAASIKEDLVRRGREFSFFQAMRLLLIMSRHRAEDAPQNRVRVRPELSLAFPSSDVASIDETRDGYLMTVTFLGLYGQSSPLPTFYTEQLLDEAASEKSATRDFLDILNHRFYTLFFECVNKHRLFSEVSNQRNKGLQLMLRLLGSHGATALDEDPSATAQLSYAGLLLMRSRSASGLGALLADALQVPVKVAQCRTRQVSVPAEQRLQLGVSCAAIGEDAVLGSEVTDRAAKILIQLGPLDREAFSSYLPGTPGWELLDHLVKSYLKTPLVWDVKLKLAAGEAPPVLLGKARCSLGHDSWLAPNLPPPESLSVIFPGKM